MKALNFVLARLAAEAEWRDCLPGSVEGDGERRDNRNVGGGKIAAKMEDAVKSCVNAGIYAP
ncbi:hypothetical protein ABD76_09580 [Paenibacillus dendritiformis]|nr:hypothetical protein [Paenibacillus dendritiformis]